MDDLFPWGLAALAVLWGWVVYMILWGLDRR